jgi:hypothetical protein
VAVELAAAGADEVSVLGAALRLSERRGDQTELV